MTDGPAKEVCEVPVLLTEADIVCDDDGRLLARARTVWCPIDLETGRPMKVDDDVRRRFSVPALRGTFP